MRSERANFVSRRKYVGGSANDVGFLCQPDGTFDMIVSEFETGTGAHTGPTKRVLGLTRPMRLAFGWRG